MLQPADDVLFVLDFPAGNAPGERLVEFVLVLRHERTDEEAVECDLAPHELLEILDGVGRFGVVSGDVAADLETFMRRERGQGKDTMTRGD